MFYIATVMNICLFEDQSFLANNLFASLAMLQTTTTMLQAVSFPEYSM